MSLAVHKLPCVSRAISGRLSTFWQLQTAPASSSTIRSAVTRTTCVHMTKACSAVISAQSEDELTTKNLCHLIPWHLAVRTTSQARYLLRNTDQQVMP